MTRGWCQSGGVIWRSTVGGSVALLADGRVAGTLTGLDHELWGLLADPTTRQQLVDRLTHLSHRSPPSAYADVDSALRRLATRGLVREVCAGLPA